MSIILPDPTNPFARTPADVLDSTGATVTETQIATARGIISAAVGYALGAPTLPDFRARDLRLLTEAIDWQAAYVAGNPGITTQRGDLAAASTNGNSLTFRDGDELDQLLAPLAKMTLRRLSWRRSRSVKLKRAPDNSSPQTLVSDGADAEWTPLR